MVPLLARVNAYSARNALRGSVAGPSIDSDRSACGGRSTSSAACALSLPSTGSGACDCTAAARPSVVPACAAVAVTASENDWVAPAASVSMVQVRSEEHTSELQSLMRTSYAVFCLKKKTLIITHDHQTSEV